VDARLATVCDNAAFAAAAYSPAGPAPDSSRSLVVVSHLVTGDFVLTDLEVSNVLVRSLHKANVLCLLPLASVLA
jgi:hypothetical protein